MNSTELIRKIKSDHRFDLIGFRRNFKNNHLDKSFYISLIAKYKMPNSVLIHYWSRSIEDVILRTIFSRFKSFKQSDQSEFFSKIKSGELPYRLKMMAYLNIQKEYLIERLFKKVSVKLKKIFNFYFSCTDQDIHI